MNGVEARRRKLVIIVTQEETYGTTKLFAKEDLTK
jgi:hypothetical protein